MSHIQYGLIFTLVKAFSAKHLYSAFLTIVKDYNFCMPLPFTSIDLLFTLKVDDDINWFVKHFDRSVAFIIVIDSFFFIFLTFAVYTNNLIEVAAIFYDLLQSNLSQ